MYPNLKMQLWRRGLRQNRLAQMLSMDESLVSRVLNGFREPSQQFKQQVASVLQQDEHWLFEKTERAAFELADPPCAG